MESDLIRLRKELLNAKETIEDLRDELRLTDEKYMRLQEEFEEREEVVRKAREDLSSIDSLVEQKIVERLEKEIKSREILEDLLREKNDLIDRLREEQEKLINKEKMLLRDHDYLKSRIGGTTSGNYEIQEMFRDTKKGKEQEDKKDKEISQLIAQLNELSKQTQNLIAENRVLREMAGTPENFGIPINEIKLAEKEKLEEYKTKLKYFEQEIHSLERERAILRARLRERPRILGREDFTKDLTPDQIILVENFIYDLRQGKSEVEKEGENLRRENKLLRMEIERLKRGGSADLERIVQHAVIKKSQGEIQDVEGGLVDQIKQENNKLLKNLHDLLSEMKIAERGPSSPLRRSQSLKKSISEEQAKPTVEGSRLTYPPEPIKQPNGSIVSGLSHRFPGAPIPVVPFDIGRYNEDRITKEEFAFLQLSLIEVIELNERKNSELRFYSTDQEKIRTQLKSFILQRNELYKDYASTVCKWKTDTKGYQGQISELTDFLREERIKNNDLEKLLAALKSELSDSELKERLINTIKKSSILEVSLMQLTRKYLTLQQEYKLMHNQYMNQENDSKDREVQLEVRLTSLKEWKAKAVLELKYLYEKLRTSVSAARYDRQRKELEALKGKEMQWLDVTKELALLKSDYVTLERARVESEAAWQNAEDMLLDADQELKLLQGRLKRRDPQYAYERVVIERIIKVFKLYRLSLDELFEGYDKDRNETISQDDFKNILELLNLDLSPTELEVAIHFVDIDGRGMIRYKSLIRTLKRYGVKNKRMEEEIIHKAAQKLKQTGIDLQDAFKLVDRDNNQLISKHEMLDALISMKLGIGEEDLMNAINYIYPEGMANLDYRRFCRVFEKSLQSISKDDIDEKNRWKIEVLQKIDEKMMEQKMSLHNAFAITPEGNVTKKEFEQLCMTLLIPISSRELDELYADFDKSKTGVAAFADIAAAIILAKVSKGAGKVDVKDTEFDPRGYNEANDIEAVRMKLAILQEREKIALNKLRRESEQVERLQNFITKRNEDCASLDKTYHQLADNHFKLQKLLVEKETILATCITKDESMELKQKYEKVEREMLDKDAAMQTYKVMYEALLQQMRYLELAFGRKRDENFDLHKALLEVQSSNDKDNLMGKLYFIVLLSRWQEGITNRKYDTVITDTKRLKHDVYTAETEIAKKGEHVIYLETRLQDSSELISQLNDRIGEQQIAENALEKIRELTGRLKEQVTVKIDTELVNINLREKNIKFGYEVSRLTLERNQAKELADVLKYMSESEITKKYIELTDKMGAAKLGELRAQSEATLSKEKEIFLEKINNEYLLQINKLEEELGETLSSLQRAEEAYKEKDKERERLFFELRQVRKVEVPITASIGKSTIELPSGKQQLTAKPESEKISEVEEKGGANIELMNLLKEKDEQLKEREEAIEKLRTSLTNLKKESMKPEFRESIVFTKIDVEIMQEEQKRQMTDVAFKTIRTLEKIINNQKEQLKRKDNYIKEIRNDSANKRQEMLSEISKLQKELALQTQKAMERPLTSESARPTTVSYKGDILELSTLTTELDRRDGNITELTRKLKLYEEELEKRSELIEDIRKKNIMLEEKVVLLDQKERVEQVQKDLAKTKKELEKRNKDYNGLKDTIEKLRGEFEAYSSINIKNVEDTNAYASKEKPYDHGKAILEQQLRHAQHELQQQTKVLAKAQEKLLELDRKSKELKSENTTLKNQLDEERKLHFAAERKLNEERGKPAPTKAEKTPLIIEESKGVSKEVESLNKEIEKLKREVEKLKSKLMQSQGLDDSKESLKFNTEKAVMESTVVKDIPDTPYIDEIIEFAGENIQLEIKPIEVFEAYLDNVEFVPKERFSEICEKIGLRFSENNIEILLKNLKSGDDTLSCKEFAYALKGALFRRFMDAELCQLGQTCISLNLPHGELSDNFNNATATQSDIENKMLKILNIPAEDKIIDYFLKRIKVTLNADQFDEKKLLSLIEKAIKICLIETMRQEIRTASTEPDMLFAEVDLDYNKRITRAEFANLLNNVQSSIKTNCMDYLMNVFDSKDTGMIDFEMYCNILMIDPTSSNAVKIAEESKKSQDMSMISRRTARIILNCIEEEKLPLYFIENDFADTGMVNISEAIRLLLKLNSKELRKGDVLMMLKELDVQNARQFCRHSLARRIVELAQDNSSIYAILRRILSVCTRKGPPLNNPNGLKQSFINKDSSGRIAVSRFKTRLLEIVPGLIDAEMKAIEIEFTSSEVGKIDLRKFVDVLFSPELRKSPSIISMIDSRKSKKEATIERLGTIPTSQQALKGKLEEVLKENINLKQENNALNQEITKIKKQIVSTKFDFTRPSEKPKPELPHELLQYSAKIVELEKSNYELIRKVDTECKPVIERLRAAEEKYKTDIRFLKLENLKLQSQVEKMLKKPMDGVERKHELDYMRDTKIAEQEKKIQQLIEDLKKTEEKAFELEQKRLDLQFEKENFDLERSRMERRIKDLERFQEENH